MNRGCRRVVLIHLGEFLRNYSYDILHQRLHDLVVTDGRAADQGHAAAIVPHLRADDLVIRDLGYFSLEALSQITDKRWGAMAV